MLLSSHSSRIVGSNEDIAASSTTSGPSQTPLDVSNLELSVHLVKSDSCYFDEDGKNDGENYDDDDEYDLDDEPWLKVHPLTDANIMN